MRREAQKAGDEETLKLSSEEIRETLRELLRDPVFVEKLERKAKENVE